MATNLVFNRPPNSSRPVKLIFGEDTVEYLKPFAFSIAQTQEIEISDLERTRSLQVFFQYTNGVTFKQLRRRYANGFSIAEHGDVTIDRLSTSDGAIFTVEEHSGLTFDTIHASRKLRFNAVAEQGTVSAVVRSMRRMSFSVAEHATVRAIELDIPQSGMALSIHETAGLTFSTIKGERPLKIRLDQFEVLTAQIQHNYALGQLTIPETSSISMGLQLLDNALSFTLTEVGDQRFTLNEVRRFLRNTIVEKGNVTSRMGRRRSLSLGAISLTGGVAQIELKKKLIDLSFKFSVAQTEGITLKLSKSAANPLVPVVIPPRAGGGSMPSYSYRPPIPGVNPILRMRSNRRSRLWAGGTYFRVRDSGLMGNQISVELVDTAPVQEGPPVLSGPGQEEEQRGWLVVTNHNVMTEEMVEGPVDVVFLESKLKWNEKIVITNLTTTPRAQFNSISMQIGGAVETSVDLGPVSISGLIRIHPYVTAQVTPRLAEMTPTSTITFKPRTTVYELEPLTATTTPADGSAGTTISGWDPADLRLKMVDNPWVEMLERSGTGAPGSGNTGSGTPDAGAPASAGFDVQDLGVDDLVMVKFPDTFMEGGDGLPPTPSAERTGPSRSIIKIGRGEKQNGELGDVNVVYEWAGSSSTSGAWKKL